MEKGFFPWNESCNNMPWHLRIVVLLFFLFSSFVWAIPCGEWGEILVVDVLTEVMNHTPVIEPPPQKPKRPTGEMGRIYDDNAKQVREMKSLLRGGQAEELELFYAHYQKNKLRYEEVARKVGLPPALIAALHWRESTGDFGTYMHQGDPLGRPARNHPRNIPLFHRWEPSAVHAFKRQAWVGKGLHLTKDTTDLAALATYAEYYNGLGYWYRRVSSPYVFSGTNQYSRGKYVADGRYSRAARDRQLGVALMIRTISDRERKPKPSNTVSS